MDEDTTANRLMLPGFPDLARLLEPRSIAVVGASDQPGNLGGVAVRFLQRFGFPGAIHPVNPRRPAVHGIPSVATLAELREPADLAILATSAASIPGLVHECGAAGIRFAVVWAGGFAETGIEGRALQEELVRACRESRVDLVGPNCIGIIDSWRPTIASFASFLLDCDRLLPGGVSMVSQSGGLATMAQALAQQAGIGFRFMISAGNEATLTLADFVHALAGDPRTRIVALYLEGVRDGERFLAALDACRAAGKPVIVLKGGDSAASARAVAAHTGALAGERRVWDAILRDHGAIRVDSLEELLDVALFLGSTDLARLPRGPGVAPVTTGGGIGVLSADQCARAGLTTPVLSAATLERLRPIAPPIAAVENPIDLTPSVYNQPEWFRHFGAVLDTIAADPGIDTVLIQFGPMGLRGDEVARELVAFRTRCPKCVCIAWPLAPPAVPDLLREAGIHVFTEYARAVGVIGRLVGHRAAAGTPPRASRVPQHIDWAGHVGPVTAGAVIPEHACHRILAAAGLTVAPGRLARGAAEAVSAAHAVGTPVAMKGISSAITHRAAAGLVALDLVDEVAIAATFARFTATAEKAGSTLDGVYVQRMIPDGIEIILSAFRDPVAGPVVSVGAGGGFTELLDDVTLAEAPVDREGALRMLRRLRLVASLARRRDAPPLESLADYLARLSQIAADAPWKRFVLEVNPVKWSAKGVTAVDGLLIIEEC